MTDPPQTQPRKPRRLVPFFRRMRRLLFAAISVLSLLLCLATAVVWVRSYWVTHVVNVSHGRWRVEVFENVGAPILSIFHDDGPAETPWFYAVIRGPSRTHTTFPAPMTMFLGFGAIWSPADRTLPPDMMPSDLLILVVPYWGVCLLSGILPAIWLPLAARRFRRARRLRRGRCVACGYDLRASGDICPECGRSVVKVGPPRASTP